MLALGKSRNISRNLLSGPVVAGHKLARRATGVLHVGTRRAFTMLLHLRTKEAARATGRLLHGALRAARLVTTEI